MFHVCILLLFPSLSFSLHTSLLIYTHLFSSLLSLLPLNSSIFLSYNILSLPFLLFVVFLVPLSSFHLALTSLKCLLYSQLLVVLSLYHPPPPQYFLAVALISCVVVWASVYYGDILVLESN